jgi:hypothetical protein
VTFEAALGAVNVAAWPFVVCNGAIEQIPGLQFVDQSIPPFAPSLTTEAVKLAVEDAATYRLSGETVIEIGRIATVVLAVFVGSAFDVAVTVTESPWSGVSAGAT